MLRNANVNKKLFAVNVLKSPVKNCGFKTSYANFYVEKVDSDKIYLRLKLLA